MTSFFGAVNDAMDKGIAALIGKTLVAVEVNKADRDRDYDEIVFQCADGDRFRMTHFQDCCETVEIEEIAGDLEDLIGQPILVAEEREQDNPDNPECETWTFYTLRNVNASVDIRWLGSSNGYYSHSVAFYKIDDREEARRQPQQAPILPKPPGPVIPEPGRYRDALGGHVVVSGVQNGWAVGFAADGLPNAWDTDTGEAVRDGGQIVGPWKPE